MEPWAAAKQVSASVAVPSAPSQRPLAPSVASIANDKSDHEMLPGAVICLMAKEYLS